MARTLAVGRGAPWLGPRSGNSLRREAFLRGAASVGPVDYVMLGALDSADTETPSFIQSVSTVDVISLRTGGVGHIEWQARALLDRAAPPYELSRFRVADPQRTRVGLSQLFPSHDVLWLLDKHAAYMVDGMLDALPLPSLLDLDELVAERCAQEIALLRVGDDRGLRERMDATVHCTFLKRNERAWDHWTRRLASVATVSTVAKEDDVQTLSQYPVVPIPNGCFVPPQRAPSPPRERPPVLVFHGLMNYTPNVDGARFLVKEVLPHLERLIGRDFEMRIVGKASPEVVSLMVQDDRVTVTGYVDDIRAELARADIVVVPLRIGSGTRIKILEALAECVPVVSTTVGCEGIGASDGVQLLVADDAESFASACRRVLEDPALRASLTDQGYRLVAERFDWSAVESLVAELTLEHATTP